MNSSTKKRDIFVDAIRGFSVLGVLAIHTAFWHGEWYTPLWFRSLTLLVDVPLFFFISGWASSMGRMGDFLHTLKSLWRNFFVKGIFFVCILLLLGKFFQIDFIKDSDTVLTNLALDFSFIQFPILNGSMWFVPYYLRTIVINQLLLCVLKPALKQYGYSEDHVLFALFLLELVLFLFSCGNVNYLPFNLTQYDLFHSTMWLLGAIVGKRKLAIRKGWIFCALILFTASLFLISAKWLGLAAKDVQSMKFASKPAAMLPWLFYSLLSICLALYLRTKPNLVKFPLVRPLVAIGQNAIFYLFAQGITSNWIKYMRTWPLGPWWLRFVITFLINVMMAVIIAEALRLCEKAYLRLLRYMKTKLISQDLIKKIASYFVLEDR